MEKRESRVYTRGSRRSDGPAKGRPMPKHLILLSTDPTGEGKDCKELPEMVRLIDRLRRDGVLLATEALRPTKSATRVRLTAGGDFSTVDGPFAEAKELVGGFVLLDTPSRAEAIDIARQILALAAAGVTAEVREGAEPPGAGR